MATTTLQSTGKDLLINNMLTPGGANTQSDYEENNPKASSYIKNRPFYDTSKTQKIVSGTLTYGADGYYTGEYL